MASLALGAGSLTWGCGTSAAARSARAEFACEQLGFPELCARVEEHWESGRLSEGDQLLEAALDRWPDQVELLEMQASALVRRGFKRASERTLVKAARLDGNRPSVWLALARVRVELELGEAGQRAASRALALESSPEGYLWLARALRRQAKWNHATLAYERAVHQGAHEGSVLIECAGMQLELRTPAPDLQLCEHWMDQARRAVELEPDRFDAHWLLARCYFARGKASSALEHARVARSLVQRDRALEQWIAKLENAALPDERSTSKYFYERQ
jgi:cytochrome c-type biogenesis protein CcmH/NrfG